MDHFTPPVQRQSLYDQMPALRQASLATYERFKAMDMEHASVEEGIHSFAEILKEDAKLDRTWSLLAHYDQVVNDKHYRELHAQELELYEAHATGLLLDPVLFGKISQFQLCLEKAIQSYEEAPALIETLHVYTKAMKKAGSHLDYFSRKKLEEIALKISALAQKFEENNLDASEKVVINCGEKELEGLLPSHLALLKKDLQTGYYQINLTPLCRQLILEYASDRSLREQYYKYAIKKCGPLDPLFDNASVAQSLLKLKKEKAELLGFNSYRAFQVSDRFAGQESNLEEFYHKFFETIPLHAHAEHNRLREFAYNRDQIDLKLWDVPYYARLEEESLLSLNAEELSQYFPVTHVTQYLFQIFSEVYDLNFVARPAQPEDGLWHDDLTIVDVSVLSSGEPLGQIYMDLFQREGKMSGAWMSGFQNSATYPLSQTSIIFCVCNTQSKEKFLLEEVQTLFHEFGHSLHGLLSRKPTEACSGIDNVPWDIVELPSILSEQWVANPEHLKKMSQHLLTKESLPDSWIAAVLKKTQYGAGKFLLRQVILGFYDWSIHGSKTPSNLLDLWQNLNGRYAVTPVLKEDSFPMTFTHIFSGGYSAGYYSYLWAEVYVHQVYRKMQDLAKTTSWREAGQSFKDHFLSLGADPNLKSSLETFLGEPLTIEPLIQHYGLQEEVQ